MAPASPPRTRPPRPRHPLDTARTSEVGRMRGGFGAFSTLQDCTLRNVVSIPECAGVINAVSVLSVQLQVACLLARSGEA